MPLFSITIPSYNYGHLISKTLDSVLTQNHDDYEIIIVDDGSTDNTAQVVAKYCEKYPQIHYFYQPNGGPSKARNVAMSKAQGQYIYMLDADDSLLPNALTVMSQALSQNPEADFIAAAYYAVDGKKRLRPQPKFHGDSSKNFRDFINKKFSLPHGAHIIRRELLNKIKYPENIKGREDIVFLAQILANSRAYAVSEPVLEVIKHSDSLRHQTQSHQHAFALVDALFDQTILPANCLALRKEFQGRLCLSFFNDHYKAQQFSQARHWFYQAIKIDPLNCFKWAYFKKFIKSFFRKNR